MSLTPQKFMTFIKKNLLKLLLLAFVVFVPVLTLYANTDIIISGSKVVNPIGVKTIDEFIRIILQGAIQIGIPIIALAVIYSGFLFVQARGNPEAIKKAKDALMYTLIGAAILLGSWAIAQLISNTILAL